LNPLLNKLLTDEFRTKVAFASTPSVLRFALLRTTEVAAVSEAIESGALGVAELKEFIEELLGKFERGVRFEEDFALAAIAVAVEKHHTEFATEYLHELAGLRVQEFEMVSGVAKESLRRRSGTALHRKSIIISSEIDLPFDVASVDVGKKRDELSNVVVTLAEPAYAQA
jgi:hypothetical protein